MVLKYFIFITQKKITMAAVLFQAGVPVIVGFALVCTSIRKNVRKETMRVKELARGRERFRFFANGA